jgi:hypothetical protein
LKWALGQAAQVAQADLVAPVRADPVQVAQAVQAVQVQVDPVQALLVQALLVQVDLVRVDLVRVDLVRVDLVRERGLDRARRVARGRLRKRLCRARTRV